MRVLRITVALSLLFFWGSSPDAQQLRMHDGFSSGQETSGLSGKVFDRNGAVIVNAEVSVLEKGNVRLKTRTNNEGVYKIDLSPGFYNIEIWALGFATFHLDCYQVPLGSPLKLDVTLTVGGEQGCPLKAPRGRRTPSRQKSEKSTKPFIIE